MRYFNKNLFIHFALGSIPAAFLGGIWSLDLWIYKKILGGVLFFAILRMLFKKDLKNSKIKKPSIFVAIIVGIVIGGLSGLIGIGGGIILTPVILLLHWGT